MAKLILNPTASSRREIRLHRSLLSIGRDPSNDLVLPDAMVSRRHAVIEYRGSQYYLRDCNSSNGSVVNGDRVAERSLRDGDLVAIGTARILFREEAELDDPEAKVVPHPSSPRFQCPSCQKEYRRGDLFCRECGTQLAVPSGPPKAVCASCGTAVPLPARFCNACGAPLATDEESPLSTKPQPVEPEVGAAEEEAAPAPAGPADVETADGKSSAEELAAAAAGAEAAGGPAPPPAVAEGAPAPVAGPAEPFRRPGGGGTDPPRLGPVASAAAVAPAAAPPRPAPRVRDLQRSSPSGRQIPAPAASAPAGFVPRALAGLLDALIVGAAQALLLAPALYYWATRAEPRFPADVGFLPILLTVAVVPVAVLLGVAYYACFWGMKGATPGQRVLGLVVQAEDGTRPVGLRRALLRVFGYVLSGATLGVGFLMIAFSGRGLHDRIARTRVVRPRGK